MSTGSPVMRVNNRAVLDTASLPSSHAALAEKFVDWLESGVRPIRLFDADVFADLSLPHWRVQATGPDELFAIREADHHGQGRVRVEHLDRTARGFLLQFEERWVANGQHWYARASAR
jgi:hypothetical protein